MRNYGTVMLLRLCVIALAALLLSVFSAFAQNSIKVSGIVTNNDGEAIIGASVLVKGTNTGVPTDINGRYEITVAPDVTLTFTSVGYTGVERLVHGRSVINVVLSEDNTFLESVVVVGYGSQKKGSITGSVSAVTNEDIIRTKSENPQNMLTGRVAGLRVWQKSAEPGSYNNSFDIRGFGTPLVIIDGVPREVSDFQRLNANDIENISVLKDASAAIYGVRGGNGVILVTTKKGQVDTKTKVSYNGSFTFQVPSKMPTLTSATDAMTLYNEMQMNTLHDGSLLYSSDEIAAYANGSKTATDWNSLVFADWVPQTQHDVSVSGGNDKVQFYLSFGYLYQEGFFKSGDLNYDKYNIRSNVTVQIANGLTLDLNISGMVDEQNNPYWSSVDIIRNYWSQGVLSPAYVDEEQTMLNHTGLDLMNNTVAMMTSDVSGYRKYSKKTIQTSATLSYELGTMIKLLSGLKVNAMFSYDWRNYQNETFQKEFYLWAVDETTGDYVSTVYPSHTNNITKENYNKQQVLGQFTLEYQRQFGKHEVGAMAGWEIQTKKGDNYSLSGDLSSGTASLTALSGENQVISVSNSLDDLYDLAYESLIGRINYNYDERYLVEFQFRYDGSSKFSTKKRWGFFPSFSVGWRLSQEPFFKEITALNFVNQLKFRLSYGMLGSDDDMDYDWLSGYEYQGGTSSSNGYYNAYAPGYIFGGSYIYAVIPQALQNLDATWYTIYTFDAGVDFEMWNGLFGGTFDYFRRLRKGLYASSSTELPTVVGAEAPVRNANSDLYFGLELELYHRNKINEFSYEVTGMASVTRQKYLTYVQGGTYGNRYDYWRNNNMSNRYQGVVFGYEGAGRYTSWEDIWSYDIYKDGTELPGDYKYVDWNGDGIIDSNDEHPICYDQTPWLNYSLEFTCNWRNWDFSMLWQGSAMGSLLYSEPLYSIWGQSNGGGTLTQYLDRWHPADGSYDIYDPTLEWVSGYYGYTGSYPYSNSTFNQVSTAYLRLKSIELGYTLPRFRINQLRDFTCRIYFNAYNSLTITAVKFVDPEHPSDSYGRLYPLNRTYTLGLNISF